MPCFAASLPLQNQIEVSTARVRTPAAADRQGGDRGGRMKTRASISQSRIGPLAACALVTLAVALAPAAHAQDKVFVMKMSTATINDTQHEWLKRFSAAVEKDSGGRIKGEIYPASQLGPIPRQIEGVQFGSVQVYIGPPEFLSGIDVRYEALSAPGLFSSTDQAVRVINDP